MATKRITRTTKRATHQQLSLDVARRPDKRHGGWRPNAGRPHKPGSISHATRQHLASRFPQHITLRIADGVPSLATPYRVSLIRDCIRVSHKPGFRIIEFNVLGNHLHLITEANDNDSLERGIQGFTVRVARRMNRQFERCGSLFGQRYHLRILTNPTQTRYALRYVLQNRKHHNPEKRFASQWFDPCSSAPWFDGWATKLHADTYVQQELLEMTPPTAKATTWLLQTGWKRLGLLRLDEAPA